jgi:hypothetical protein
VPIRRRVRKLDSPLSWAQRSDPYDGPLRPQYRRAVDMLVEAQPRYDASDRSTQRYRTLARTLSVLAALLAGAATITILPDSIDRYVGATLAFFAAVTSALAATLKPERESTRAARTALQWLQLRDAVYEYLRWIPTLPPVEVSQPHAEQRLHELIQQRNSILAQAIADTDAVGLPEG